MHSKGRRKKSIFSLAIFNVAFERWIFTCCAQLPSDVSFWGTSLTLPCQFIGLLLWRLMQIGLAWIPMYLLVCTRNRTTLAIQQFCLHSDEWKNLIKSHLPSLLASAFKIKIPSPYIEESFYLYCSKRRSACQKCYRLGAVQTALEEFLITSAISWIHFHTELQ